MTPTDRRRWLALYTLCAGVLMIVLDATIVNVALPSIAADLQLLDQRPQLGGQRLPRRLRRAAPPRGSRRRPASASAGSSSPAWRVFVAASLACALAVAPWMLVGGPAGARRRRRPHLGGRARHDRLALPRAGRARQGHRRLRLRRLGRWLDRAPGGRPPHRGARLALDLPGQPPRRHRHRVWAPCGTSTPAPRRRHPAADVPSAALLTAGLMAGVYTIVEIAQRGAGASAGDRRGSLPPCSSPSCVRQARLTEPLLPLRLFRSRS